MEALRLSSATVYEATYTQNDPTKGTHLRTLYNYVMFIKLHCGRAGNVNYNSRRGVNYDFRYSGSAARAIMCVERVLVFFLQTVSVLRLVLTLVTAVLSISLCRILMAVPCGGQRIPSHSGPN